MFNRKTQDDPALSAFTEIVSDLVADFVPHPEFPRFRIPVRATPLDPICDHLGIDAGNDPHSISRNLFMLEWDSLPGWRLHALRVSSDQRVYWVDDANGKHIIAVGPSGIGADQRFAKALFKDNGKSFGTAILDSAPSRITTCLRGDLLITLFLDAIYCSENAWGAVEFFFRSHVRQWLKDTLAQGGKELRDPKRLSRAAAQSEFLTLVERLVSDFHPHPDEPQVGVPRRFTPLHPLAKLLGKKVGPLSESVSHGLLRLAWWGAPGSTVVQEINVLLLPDRTRVFWIYLDVDEDEAQQYFIVGTATQQISDMRFLQLLFAGDGTIFGLENVCGSPPCEISTRLAHTQRFTDLFVSAFNAFPQAWDSLDGRQEDGKYLDYRDPADARELVNRHLQRALHSRNA